MDGQTCQHCGYKHALCVHHIEGHSNDMDNLMTLCESCHLEWESVAQATKLTFAEWLYAPPYLDLLSFWRPFYIAGQTSDAYDGSEEEKALLRWAFERGTLADVSKVAARLREESFARKANY